MKKMMLAAAGILFATAGFSQISVGLQGIANAGTAQVNIPEVPSFSKTSLVLPGAGIVAQYDLSGKLALRTGVNYIEQGVQFKATLDNSAPMSIEAENTLHYLQVPVSLLYIIPAGKIKLYAGLGGYFNYGIGGDSKQTTTLMLEDGTGSVTVEKLKAFKKEADNGAGLKRADAGAAITVGTRLNNGLFVNAGYQHSITDISNGDGKYRNRGVQISVGYFF